MKNIFDLFKNNKIKCSKCGSHNITPIISTEEIETIHYNTDYICNNCGQIFTIEGGKG